MSKNKAKRALCAILICAACCPLLGSSLIDASDVNENGVEYDTVLVERGDYIKTATNSAVLHYPVAYNVSCKVRNARLASIAVGRSEELTEGDILGTFTSEGSRAELYQARLSLSRAEEAYETGLAERKEAIEEAKRLMPTLTDATDKEIARLRLEQKQADLEAYSLRQEYDITAMKKRVAEMEEALTDVTVYAPATGIIYSYSYLNVGDSVYYNQVLLSMYDSSKCLLKIEDENGKFRYGMRLKVTYGPRNDRQECEAVVVSADNVLSYNERKGFAYALPLNADIPNGQFAMINVEGEQVRVNDVLLIPKRSTTLDSGKNFVSILEGSSIAKRYVNVALSNTDSSWILQGLEEGQVLILD